MRLNRGVFLAFVGAGYLLSCCAPVLADAVELALYPHPSTSNTDILTCESVTLTHALGVGLKSCGILSKYLTSTVTNTSMYASGPNHTLRLTGSIDYGIFRETIRSDFQDSSGKLVFDDSILGASRFSVFNMGASTPEKVSRFDPHSFLILLILGIAGIASFCMDVLPHGSAVRPSVLPHGARMSRWASTWVHRSLLSLFGISLVDRRFNAAYTHPPDRQNTKPPRVWSCWKRCWKCRGALTVRAIDMQSGVTVVRFACVTCRHPNPAGVKPRRLTMYMALRNALSKDGRSSVRSFNVCAHYFGLSRRKSWSERVISRLGWYPWRCHRCRKRYYFLIAR